MFRAPAVRKICWWWSCLLAATAAAAAADVVGNGGHKTNLDVFDVLEEVGDTLDLNDRYGRNLYWLLERIQQSAGARDVLEDLQEDEDQPSVRSFFAANKFTFKLPPHVFPKIPFHRPRLPGDLASTRHRHRAAKRANRHRQTEKEVGENEKRMKEEQEEATRSEEEDGREEDAAVPETRRNSKGWWKYVVMTVCSLLLCCCALLLQLQITRRYLYRYEDLGLMLGKFVHAKESVLRLFHYHWKFGKAEPQRHDDLLLFVQLHLRDVYDAYRRDFLDPMREWDLKEIDQSDLVHEFRKKERIRQHAESGWNIFSWWSDAKRHDSRSHTNSVTIQSTT